MNNAIEKLANAIAKGTGTSGEDMFTAMKSLFGGNEGRYTANSVKDLNNSKVPFFRNAYGKEDVETQHVAYAGFINPDNPSSGPYGGMSLVWFPTPEGSMISFGLGTRGLSPDEGILTRSGHRRRIDSLRRHLRVLNAPLTWAKQDPAAQGSAIPDSIVKNHLLASFKEVFSKYGNELYCLALIPKDDAGSALSIVQSFLDLYAYERNWEPFARDMGAFLDFISGLNSKWLNPPSEEDVIYLLNQRRFVVLEGPPGTGKSRLAKKILHEQFSGNGNIIQFHPATTYEDFVVGLSPNVHEGSLSFQVKSGHLIKTCSLVENNALLVIDEINRADLGRVLGEAIYLLEASDEERTVLLPHEVNGTTSFTLPKNLFILATMNTADRSVAHMDIAIRRRFAFVTMMPDREVVKNCSTKSGLRMFDQLCDVFLEYAPDDALSLLPGHSYFIAKDEAALQLRMQYELLPLLDEYIREGYLGPATPSFHAVRNSIADFIQN